MATTVESIRGTKTWTFHDEPHEFYDSSDGWDCLRMTMGDAFEVCDEHEEAMDAVGRAEGAAEFRAACAVRDKADANWQVAWGAVVADICALARAMEREGWGTYSRAVRRVESYYRECYRDRFGG